MGTKLFIRKHLAVFISGAGVFLLFVLLFSLFRGEYFSLDIFDIGQGDAILITTLSGERVLIDGGPDATIVAKLSRRLGIFNRTIDLVIATHPQADHITGLLSVLDRFHVRRVMLTTIENETPEYRALREKIVAKQIPVIDAADTSRIAIGEVSPVTIEILWPRRSYDDRRVDDPNVVSTVFRLTHGGKRFLFTGDAGSAVEQQLLESGEDLRADVLKVGHHGSDTSTTQAFLDAVSPSLAVISVGRNNRFGHPSRRVLKRLERAGTEIYRTDMNGDIRIVSDGKKIRVSPARR